MISKVSRVMTTLVSKYLPDPLIFAVLLSFVTFLCAWGLTDSTPVDLVNMWGDGFWNLLGFGMQMALIVVTGNALATSPLVKSFLGRTASIAQTPAQGVMLVTFMGAIASIINWGFGLVVGAMFAKEVARRIKGTDYALLIACAYIGFMTWGGGFSGSMPLLAATPGNPVAHLMITESNPQGIIPASSTLFSGYNLFIIGLLVLCLPFITRMMMPKEGEVRSIDPALLAPDPVFTKQLGPDATLAERMEESRLLAYAIGALGYSYLGMYFYKNGFNLTINNVNLIFLITGILLHGTPMAYMRAIVNATKSTSGILIQFPFYAGIQLMMEHSGLGGLITEFFINIATKDTFPVLTFFSSALINFAVPSGGGHWVIQGPFVIPAAQALGADLGKSTMAIAYGEQWMNMAQPFWALPALGIAGLGVRDVMGYCMTALIFTAPIFVIGLYFL
ncbi:Short-chain fatty acids transporter [Neisseria animaloris]|uniref:Short-chain fatty acids transporter n=1 Tax=Neisseria animaloris TaxID=326522 RepID=A0A1X3CHJ9_9NEIS|nr:TIGR00366 family protein [Neisseria animaloris]MDO5073716.1 TIGR00366 family protein [Neisseria animaloris]OSI07046.1 TIGR00366 family protein [Neisseria animaloris]VEH88226.1 Short-chain fatty acids transporter [Neisseria animaloris]VEJ21736.1 Short-chain fatty acids transporter [Neisseria animaloris]